MALTPEQIKLRRGLVGGSDANTIMGGDEERIMRLWQEKRGEIEPENLSDVLPVQMGVWTEPFNCQWFEKQTGKKVTSQGESRLCLDYPFMGSTLDGLTDDDTSVVEFKHVSAFAKPEEILDRYMPQLHHNMIVCGLEKAYLSVFFGTLKWDKFEVTKDPIYASILIGAVENFWACVKSGTPPVATKVKSPVEAVRRVDFSTNNMWANFAQQYKDNVQYNKLFEEASKGLKSLVEEDVVEAFGHGIIIKRDKKGSLRLTAKG
jgi:predicted phage-related endonuclease